MRREDRNWMAYIDGEVRAVCEAKGWGYQIRRKWSIREKPVFKSPIDDYEWKLIPDADGRLPNAPHGAFEGVYYVLWFDMSNGKFIFQHDTSHCGIMGPHWEVATYTEIYPIGVGVRMIRDKYKVLFDHPPVGWLRDHLLDLVTRFGPNNFSVT